MKAGGVVVGPDDLAQVIYCFCAGGVPVGQGFIDDGKDAAAQEKAVRAAGVGVIPDDLACIIDAERLGVLGGQGIFDRGEDIDRHVVALLIADGCHQHYHLAIRGRRTIRADLTRAAAVFDWRSRGVQKMMGYSKSNL